MGLRRSPPLSPEQVWQDDFPLFYFGKGRRDPFTVGDSFKHVFVSGASGSGKTTGSLATLFRAYLRAGYGGLVLCAKSDERARWEALCRQCGREADMVVVSTGGGMPYRFNFLQYELRRRGGGSVMNVVSLFSNIKDVIENNTRESLDTSFWDTTALDLLKYTVIVLSLCRVPLTMENIDAFIASAPQPGQAGDPDWQTGSYAGRRIQEAYANAGTDRERRDFAAAFKYFTQKLAGLNDRTRSSIEITLSTIAGTFATGDARELLCAPRTTIVPEVMWQAGKVVVLDMPISEHDREGAIMQGVIKYCWQKALMRRSLAEHPRPVFVAMDEFHNFLTTFDYRFLSEVRSAGVSVNMASQSVSNLYSILKGGGRDQVNSLLGNASTVVLHANNDAPTNEWASTRIGSEWKQMVSTSTRDGGQGVGRSVSAQIKPRLLPSAFQTLKSGGGPNYIVEGYVVQTGRIWRSTGSVYHKASFRQEFGEEGRG
jgi:type IV secretory pathway TraG/TraD family ATPase VirD4